MHEMSITQSIVEICEEHAGGRRVRSVTLEIGELSGVVPDAVEFCFAACTRDTLLDGALLTIDHHEGTYYPVRLVDAGRVIVTPSSADTGVDRLP